MDQLIRETKVDDVVHGLRCLCGGAMVLTVVEPIDQEYERHRFECVQCRSSTSVSFNRVQD
jgi:hypothetical protein